MSIIPYNNNKDVLYHNPNDGIVVVHDPRENTIKLLSTVASEARGESNGSQRTRRPSQAFNNDQFPHTTSMTKCPNCGFTWNEFNKPGPEEAARIPPLASSIYHYPRNTYHSHLFIPTISNC